MGKCIVCKKSAGPFYSLHKSCYQVYEDSRECLRTVFSNCSETALQNSEFTTALNECKPVTLFSQSLFDSLVKREWEDQAKQVIKDKSLNSSYAKYLLSIAPALEIQDIDVEPHLFTRLVNIEHLERLNQNKTLSMPSSKFKNEFNIEIGDSLMWVFDDALKLDEQKIATDAQWTVFRSILNNLFSKSRYKEFTSKIEDAGKLAITHQSLYYVTKKGVTKIDYTDIYSITPLMDGVRIQTTQRDTTPNTYITGDGRFTYSLLRHASGQKL